MFEGEATAEVGWFPSAAALTVAKVTAPASEGACCWKIGAVLIKKEEESLPDWRLRTGASLLTAGLRREGSISKRTEIWFEVSSNVMSLVWREMEEAATTRREAMSVLRAVRIAEA